MFSSNYTLYGDMSRRMNEIYHQFAPEVEVYSIDESFLDITGIRETDRTAYGLEIRASVREWTGIPTCVGIGPTKTLAKLANRTAKSHPELHGSVTSPTRCCARACCQAFPWKTCGASARPRPRR